MELAKVYEPQRFEPRWAEEWINSQLYRAAPDGSKPVFSLVIPPPNVTGSLHMGHMLEHTEIDVTIRWRRMSGHEVCVAAGGRTMRASPRKWWWSGRWPKRG